MQSEILGLLAAALTLIAGISWFRNVNRVALPVNRIWYVLSFITGLLLGAFALYLGVSWIGAIPAAFSIIAGALFVFTVAIGRQTVGSEAIDVGSSLPAFTAADENAVIFDSNSLTGRPTLIKFFRGHW